MNSNPSVPEPCLAQQAMEAYDHQGEPRMLALIRAHLDSRPTDFARSDLALQVLKDHTAVLTTSEHYVFLWHNTDSSGNFQPPRRRRELKDQRPPEPTERAIPIDGAVTRSSILHEALKRIETDVRLELGHSETGNWLGDDPPITAEALETAAPILLKELDQLAATGAESDQLYQAMDDTARELAQDIIKAAPPHEIAAVEQALRAAVTANGA